MTKPKGSGKPVRWWKRMLRTDEDREKNAYRTQVIVGALALAMSVFALLMQLLK